MCGPCKHAKNTECRSQGSARRVTTACEFCSVQRKACGNPPPSWALPIFEAANARGTSHTFILFLHFLTCLWKRDLRRTGIPTSHTSCRRPTTTQSCSTPSARSGTSHPPPSLDSEIPLTLAAHIHLASSQFQVR